MNESCERCVHQVAADRLGFERTTPATLVEHIVMPLERFWLVSHDADLTETGSPQMRTYVKTIWEGFPAQQACELEIVRDWCRSRFGPEVAYVQGVAATRNWCVDASDEISFDAAKPIVWGGYKTKTKRVALGIGKRSAVTVHSDGEA